MKAIITSVLVLLAIPCFSQLGINIRYQNLGNDLWERWANEDNLFNNSYEIGVDYWFRLKNYRVEFMPEVYTYRSSTESDLSKYRYSAYGLAVNTNFYILDFIGDCNCPTFSKDGNAFTKGFYLSLAPLLEYQIKQVVAGLPEIEPSKNTAYGIAIGAGVDIGLNDLITISPFVRYKILPQTKWDSLALERAIPGQDLTITNLSFFQFGLRLGFRPDYIREQNKYRFRR